MKNLVIKKELIKGFPKVFIEFEKMEDDIEKLILTVGIEGIEMVKVSLKNETLEKILNLDMGIKATVKGKAVLTAIKTKVEDDKEGIIFKIKVPESELPISAHISKEDYPKVMKFLKNEFIGEEF